MLIFIPIRAAIRIVRTKPPNCEPLAIAHIFSRKIFVLNFRVSTVDVIHWYDVIDWVTLTNGVQTVESHDPKHSPKFTSALCPTWNEREIISLGRLNRILVRYFIHYTLYGLNTHSFIHCNSEESILYCYSFLCLLTMVTAASSRPQL